VATQLLNDLHGFAIGFQNGSKRPGESVLANRIGDAQFPGHRLDVTPQDLCRTHTRGKAELHAIVTPSIPSAMLDCAHSPMVVPLSLTEQLQRFSGGDREIAQEVLTAVLPKLHQIAVGQLNREYYHAPVTPTELINEVWIRNLRKGGWKIRDREHFYAIAARAMRQVLVDFARNRLAQSRGSGELPHSLEQHHHEVRDTRSVTPEKVIEISDLIDKLEQSDPATARVVEMHHFAGFSLEEIADVTKLSPRQVRHRWEKGRDWLKDRLSP
jgi:RNA polymerase sigma factor (TIGR02999 family)